MKHRLRDRNQKQQKKQIVQNDPYKLSIHTSSNFNKSDSGSKRLNISRMLENSRKKISMRKASELFQTSGIRPQSTKNLKRNEVIEFDNIKWISIISAYDPSRLKNVSVSKKSCQKFLSSNQQNIKTDSRNLLYFNDLIRNFKSWHHKIQMQYCYIMNKFLRQRQSANITLAQLRPKLDQVINQTVRMQQNLEDCLKSYENHEFRELLEKYYASLLQCQKIEQIIVCVDKSKNRIVNLYKKFDDDRKIQQKITRVKNEGINQVRNIVSDYEVQIQSQIMDRIQGAINQIAQKSGEAYRKIKGVKNLIQKFKNTEHQSQEMNKIDIQAINFMGKVCKQICYEAQAFQQFSTKFLVEGGIINQDLQKIIKKYQQEVLNERRRAIQLQMKFLNIIFSQTIKKLKDNSKIAMVYENADAHNEQYRKILRMIQDIADCIIDQGKRVSLQKLIKESRTVLDRLYDDLKYLKSNKKFQEIDTQEGLISILQVSKLIKEYKDKILLVKKKFQSVHREVQLSPIKIQSIPNDQETQFINEVILLSKKINNSGLKAKLQKQPCFTSINEGLGLLQMSKQIEKQNILQEITSISNQFLQLQSKNILQKYFGPLKLQNLIFKQSIVMAELKKISSKTKQQNIIPQLTQLLSKRNQWVEKQKKISPQMKRYFERILAYNLVKGLKAQDIKQIQNPQNMTFPTKQNQIEGLKSKAKYRQVLFDMIQNSVIQTSKSIITENTDQKVGQKQKNHRNLKSAKTRFNFYISDILQKSIASINNFVSSFNRITEIRKNITSESYLSKEYFFQFSQKLFNEVFLKKVQEGQGGQNNNNIKILLNQLIEISYDRFLSLTRKILQQENSWKDNQKKMKSQSQLNLGKLPVYLQKVIDILQFYKNKTQGLYEVAKQGLTGFDKLIENVENSTQEIDDYIKLNVYAKIIHSLVKYCKETDQKVHVILDNNKSPIALINPKQNVLKQIFPGLKKGKQLTLNESQKLTLLEAKVGIQLKTKKTLKNESKNELQSKQKTKPKKKQSDMDEQILDEEGDQINDNMQEQYSADQDIEQIEDNNEEIPDDDMTEQLGEQVEEQQPQQDMVEDFQSPQDQIGQEQIQVQEQALQDLIEESQTIGKSKAKNSKKVKTNNDIDEYQWQQDTKPKNKIDNKNNNKKLKQQREKQQQKRKQEEQKKLKQQQQNQEIQKQKRMKKQHIVFSQTQIPKKIFQNTIYEMLTFISSLYQLKKLIHYVSSFEENYFKNFIDWTKVQHYYNDHTMEGSQIDKKQIEKYVKNLQEDIQVKLKNQFKSQPIVFNEIKNLDSIKRLKKDLLLLKNGNWEALQNILFQNHVSYNILKNKGQGLYVWIKQSNEEYDEIGSVHGYLSKNLKFYQRNQFDLKGFTDKCLNAKFNESKEHAFSSVLYEVKIQTSFVGRFAQIEQNYELLVKSINGFTNGTKDIVNKFDFCLQLYKKSLQIKQKVNLDLNWYAQKIKFLQKYGTDEFYPSSYMNFVKENIKAVIKKVKSLESKLYNLSFKCQRNSLFECIEELCDLYGEEIEKKVTLAHGQTKHVILLFDRTTIKQNYEKIQSILSSQPKSQQEQAQKILLSLIFNLQTLQKLQIEQTQIFKNTNKINFKSSQLLLQIIKVLRIDHSYILIKNKYFEFFVIKNTNEKCISSFFQEITKQILESKEAANIRSGGALFLALLKQLSKPQNSTSYSKILSKENLKKMFVQKTNNEKLYNQTQISIVQQFFMLNDNPWLEQNAKQLTEMIECLTESKNQTNKILTNMKKLLPCYCIYYKRFSKSNESEICNLWSLHLSQFEKILQNTKNLLEKKFWFLLLNPASQLFNEKFVNQLRKNVDTIKLLIKSQTSQVSFDIISKQVRIIFQWLQEKDKQQEKIQFSIITLQKSNQIVYFDCNSPNFSEQYFVDNFAFIESLSHQVREFLSTQLVSNMSLNKNDEILSSFKLKKNNKIYEIDAQSLSTSILTFITQILGQQSQQKRNLTVRQIVRVFNKIYYLSRTTQDFNFKQESQQLQNLQNNFKRQLQKLRIIYSFKSFLESFIKTLWKNFKITENLVSVLNKNLKNEKIPGQEIQQILLKLEKIKTNSKTNSIDSYKPFYSWFYQTVMGLMKLPFYNIITHTQENETNFLGVIVTENSSKPNQGNNQLEKLLREIFVYTQHKPIYLKQNDLTVEFIKQPAFVCIQNVINGVQLKEIVHYLNENCEQQLQKQTEKQLFLRVDSIQKSKNNDNEERSLLKTIPLMDFAIKTQQQFNINITQQQLSVQIEFNIIYAPVEDLVKKSCIPLNGASVDIFDKVYMGKQLKLDKLNSWLYSFYLKRKNQIQVENKDKQIEQFFNGFIEYFLTTVKKQSREVVNKIINKIQLQSVLKSQNKSNKNQKLYLLSSVQLLDACKKQLQKFKTKEYERKLSLQKHYDQDILNLISNFESELYQELINAESQIKLKMEKKLKTLVNEKVTQIHGLFKERKIKLEKQKLQEKQENQQYQWQKQQNEQHKKQEQIQNVKKPQQKIDGLQKLQQQKAQLPEDKPQKQVQEINKLKQTNFTQYLIKKLEIFFDKLTEQQVLQLENEILQNYDHKLKLIGQRQNTYAQLKQKISKLFSTKEVIDEIDITPYQRLLFLYFIIENNEPCYVQLYLSEK